jgi:3-oxoacyl-[acyl-carrier protein] reductase
MIFEGKVAIVTGASRGIGREIALELARNGANVVVNFAGNVEKANEVVEEIKGLGRDSIAVQANVANRDDVDRLVKETIDHFGALHILINNAGITRDNLIMRMKEDDWDDVINTNLKSVFLLTKAVTRQMMRQRYGRIVNISSIVGVSGNAGQANYVAAKAGIIGLTKTTAQELASRNITVNAVAPGYIATDMTEQLSDDVKEELFKLIPLARLGEPKDIAKAVKFLASDDAAYITGQTIHVNGGMYM